MNFSKHTKLFTIPLKCSIDSISVLKDEYKNNAKFLVEEYTVLKGNVLKKDSSKSNRTILVQTVKPTNSMFSAIFLS